MFITYPTALIRVSQLSPAKDFTVLNNDFSELYIVL